MPLPHDSAWFSRKPFGWGWGLPRNGKGWVSFCGFLYLAAPSSIIPAPYNAYERFLKDTFEALVPSKAADKEERARFLYDLTLASAFIALCYWKGEKPRWRWGSS